MIVLLGATGYIGGQFARTLQERGVKFVAPLRSEVNYGRFTVLREFLEKTRPEFRINAAGYTGKPNVDACEKNWADTLQGNTLFPAAAAHACASLDIPYGHVSSGCIYSGAKVMEGGKTRVEKDLTQPELRALLEESYSQCLPWLHRGGRAEFHISSSAVQFLQRHQGPRGRGHPRRGQELHLALAHSVRPIRQPAQLPQQAARYPRKFMTTSIPFRIRADFVHACLDLWEIRAPFGIYNVTNPGFVTTRHVVQNDARNSSSRRARLSSGATTPSFIAWRRKHRGPIA